MLVLWLTAGVVARQEAEVEQRGKGGSGKGWLLRGEFDYRDEDKPSEAITVEDIRQATAKLRPKPAPEPAPAVVASVAEAAPAAPVATLFERKPEKTPTPAPAAPVPVTLTPGTKDALGMKPVERTYDLEVLLLLAA
jgi:hypothetical protein